MLAIYVHWSGDIGHTGVILHDHYLRHARSLTALLRLGYLSEIGAKLHPVDPKAHREGKAESGVCIFHGRDMGRPRDESRAQVFPSVREWLEWATLSDCERAYLHCTRKEGRRDYAVYHIKNGVRGVYMQEIGWLTDIVTSRRRRGELPVAASEERSTWLVTTYGPAAGEVAA